MQLRSIFDVASQLDTLTGANAAALQRIFRVTSAPARCSVGPELSQKYSVPQDNEQRVVSVTNMHTLEQTWFNQARTVKPQTFNSSATVTAAQLDPTGGGATCDFCAWQTLTATDPGFLRIQLPHAVTASNLFKYAEPSHGVVIFKHHNPLEFSQAALSDLLDASWLWFMECQRHNPHTHAAHPFLLWNCLPRAGASQFHGHAQVMLSSVPVPAIDKLQRAAHSQTGTYQQQHPGCSYYADLLRAHAAVGLLRQVSVSAPSSSSGSGSTGVVSARQRQQERGVHTAWGFASLAPVKDMEVVVVGQHLCCPAFQRMLHAALRALIDGLGAVSFNVGVLNLDLAVPEPAGVGLGRQFWTDSLETAVVEGGGSSSSSSSGGLPHVHHVSSSLDGHYTYSSSSSSSSGAGDDGSGLWLPNDSLWSDRPPVVARLVSRGKIGSLASDFGGLEVVGGASIGHTEPFAVVQQLDAQLKAGVPLCSGRVVAN